MDDERKPMSGWVRARRCSPFLAVALCFGLPFFSVSSCEGGTQATTSGVGIVLGADPVIDQGPGVAEPVDGVVDESKSISRAARPWAIATLILVSVGGMVAARVRRLHRVTSLASSVAAFSAATGIWAAVGLSADGQVEGGLLFASAILLLTAVWQVCALVFLAVRAALASGGSEPAPAEWEPAAGDGSR
jgi:hypothetical protein